VVDKNEEAPVPSQVVAPELMDEFRSIFAVLRILNVGFSLAHIHFFMQRAKQYVQELVRIVLSATLKVFIHFAKCFLETVRND
jgi:hypothetical protein